MTAEGGKYDVIVLGTGIGGSMLSAVLARNQLKVLMIDSETHPRFTIGEATTPDTNFRFKLLAAKYDVPEIGYLSSFHTVRDHVSPACGVKRAFSFLYQHEGEEQDAAKMHQFPTLAPPMGPDLHFFRQDVDAYMMAAAVRYGAAIRQKTRVSEIDLRDDGASVVTDTGVKFDAEYLVDGTGINSVLAQKLDLREDPSRFRTNSRAIFTHMAGVRPYEEIGLDRKSHGFEYPLWQSTMHYVFAGGWFWLIPFGNHADSTNPLCSVGLVLNRQVHPETGMDAEEEFWSYVQKFPPMIRQFDGAKAVRPWTTTGRLQYGSKTITGPRYCLLSHAGFFIDPLYSTGLALTTTMVDLLGGTLLEAFAAKDLRVERFEYLNEFFSTNIRYIDEMVGSSFVSFREFDLWDAWFRVWVVANFLGAALNARLYSRYLETKDKEVLKRSGQEPHTVLLGGKFTEFQKLFRVALAEMDRVREGSAAPSEAAAKIRALFKDINYFPSYYEWQNPSVRTTPVYTLWELLKLHFWYLRHSTRHVNEQLLWNPVQTCLYAIRSARDNRRRSLQRNRTYLRDMFRTWNSD
jgi:tetracycline 7-halogenase / FADH2 O2-dependent halogenase